MKLVPENSTLMILNATNENSLMDQFKQSLKMICQSDEDREKSVSLKNKNRRNIGGDNLLLSDKAKGRIVLTFTGPALEMILKDDNRVSKFIMLANFSDIMLGSDIQSDQKRELVNVVR